MDWYVVHTYSGFEKKVKQGIEKRASELGLSKRVGQILVPEEQVIEIKDGRKRELKRKFFPGYVVIQMELDDETLNLIKSTPKITGFLGGKIQPAPLTPEEIETLLTQVELGLSRPRERGQFQLGDPARIIDGPFIGFEGVVDEVDKDHQRVKILVSIFGRATPVELGFFQVERL